MFKMWVGMAQLCSHVALLAYCAAAFGQPCSTEWSDQFGQGFAGRTSVMTVIDDGCGPALYLSGGYYQFGGTTISGVLRWDGAAWSAVGSFAEGGPDVLISAQGLGHGWTLIAGGAFSLTQGAPYRSVAVWDGTNWQALVDL